MQIDISPGGKKGREGKLSCKPSPTPLDDEGNSNIITQSETLIGQCLIKGKVLQNNVFLFFLQIKSSHAYNRLQ